MLNKLLLKLSFSIFLIAILTSCATTNRNLNYFTYHGNDSSHTYIQQSFEVPIQVGDQLSIVVSALNPQSAIPYNLPGGIASASSSSSASGSGGGIVVDQDGSILYPQLGSIKVVGLTKSQLRDLLITRLRTYLTDPVVTISFLNFRVTVLGEVGRPGPITLPDGKINILEALAQAGDLTTYAKKSPVTVIRENNGRREFGYVNLLSNSTFSSPYYRLQQNDIVFVQHVENKPTVENELSLRRLSYVTTVLSILTTVTFLILNFIK